MDRIHCASGRDLTVVSVVKHFDLQASFVKKKKCIYIFSETVTEIDIGCKHTVTEISSIFITVPCFVYYDKDNNEVASDLENTLDKNGYNVIGIAKNYQEALTLFYKLPVDLVIIDVFLGDNPEGITFAETISTVPNSLKPFLFL